MNTEKEGKTNKISLIENIKNNKKVQILVLIILFSLLIIFVVLSFYDSKKSNEQTHSSIDNYIENLEEKLSKRLSNVEGVANVSVIITIESGLQTIIATEKTITEADGKITTIEKPVLINGKPIVVMEKFPEITGVLIVVEGVNSLTVINRIQQATMSLLNIKLSQIEILTGK